MPGLSTFLDLSTFKVHVLVWCTWSLVPLSWLYVLGSVLPPHWTQPWWSSQTLVRSLGPFTHTILLSWAAVEVAFSLYYQTCVYRIQKRGLSPIYGRRFLRQVFSRALESGMEDGPHPHTDVRSRGTVLSQDLPRGLTSRTQSAGTSSTQNGLTSRAQKGSTTQSENGFHHAPLATNRLRSASYVPKFVAEEPLDRKDPRARLFAEQQARWFPESKPEDLKRRDVERWLAWSLYGAELEEIEEERAQAETSQKNGKKGVPAASLLENDNATGSESPTPAPVSAFANALPDDFSAEDKRGTRAKPGEWNADPVRGDRLEFLHYCRELIEARQGFAFPLEGKDWEPRRSMRLTLE